MCNGAAKQVSAGVAPCDIKSRNLFGNVKAGLEILFIPISPVLRGSLTIYLYQLNIYRDSLPKLPRHAPYWPRSSVGRASKVVGSNPTEVKFSLTRGDSQISFKWVIP